MTKEEFMQACPSRLSKMTGDYYSSWYRWLRGERSMTAESLLNASEKLEIDAWTLDQLIKQRIGVTTNV